MPESVFFARIFEYVLVLLVLISMSLKLIFLTIGLRMYYNRRIINNRIGTDEACFK